jgi:hypothetical protein
VDQVTNTADKTIKTDPQFVGWLAWFDGEEDGLLGWGNTEEEAIADLQQKAEEA